MLAPTAGAAPPIERTRPRPGRDSRTAWGFLLPMVALLAGLIGYPVLYALYLSLHLVVGPWVGAFVGLANSVDVWRDEYLAVALSATTSAFNEFLLTLVFVTSERYFTVGVGLAGMVIGDVVLCGPLAAGAVIMMLPVATFDALAQRAMVAGLTAGALQG